MKVLFVCNQGLHRSRTAAVFLHGVCETRARGIYANEASAEDLFWADIVVVMEPHQRAAIAERFPREYLSARIVCLDIPDVYSYGQPRLTALLEQRLREATPELAALLPVST